MAETGEMWTGNAGSYDQARPSPLPALLDLLTQVIGAPQPALIVDLGSGTGLSTAIWGERARQVIGIDLNADMRSNAFSRQFQFTDQETGLDRVASAAFQSLGSEPIPW